jgi:hypothetical protein
MVRIEVGASLVIRGECKGWLEGASLIRIGEAVLRRIRGGMPAEEMIEAPVLHHHDHNMIDSRRRTRREGMLIFVLGVWERHGDKEQQRGEWETVCTYP